MIIENCYEVTLNMDNGIINNTFGLKVTAAQLLEYASEEDLKALLADGKVKAPYLHVGGGSNLLFMHERYEGTVLHSQIKGVEVTAENDTEVFLRVGRSRQLNLCYIKKMVYIP